MKLKVQMSSVTLIFIQLYNILTFHEGFHIDL